MGSRQKKKTKKHTHTLLSKLGDTLSATYTDHKFSVSTDKRVGKSISIRVRTQKNLRNKLPCDVYVCVTSTANSVYNCVCVCECEELRLFFEVSFSALHALFFAFYTHANVMYDYVFCVTHKKERASPSQSSP